MGDILFLHLVNIELKKQYFLTDSVLKYFCQRYQINQISVLIMNHLNIAQCWLQIQYDIIVNNMNSKYSHNTNITIGKIKKERSSHSETPNRQGSKTNLIQLSQYFNKRHTNPSNTLPNYEEENNNKQNIKTEANINSGNQHYQQGYKNKPNINILGLSPNQNIRKYKEVTDKKINKKVITIRSSNIKNSRHGKKQYSTEKRINTQSIFHQDTEVADFDQQSDNNNLGVHPDESHPSSIGTNQQDYNENQYQINKYMYQNKSNLNPINSKQKLIPPKNGIERKSPVVIELDLHKHRKSMQDTLASSSGMNNHFTGLNKNGNYNADSIIQAQKISSIKFNEHSALYHNNSSLLQQNIQKIKMNNKDVQYEEYCSNPHHNTAFKIATFMIKGKSYCQKCAASFITNGQLALRIRSNSCSKNSVGQDTLNQIVNPNKNSHFTKQPINNEQEHRAMLLSNFIENLDEIQPKFEQFQHYLYQSPNLIHQFQDHFVSLQRSADKWFQQSIHIITQKHSQLQYQVKKSSQQTTQYLKQLGSRVCEQLENIRFMRNDIIQNIGSIVKVHIVKRDNFGKVYRNFEEQFNNVKQIEKQVANLEIVMPQFIHKSSYHQLKMVLNNVKINMNPQKSKHLFSFQESPPGKSDSENSHHKYSNSELQDQNTYRLSFGKELSETGRNEAISPTFKAI